MDDITAQARYGAALAAYDTLTAKLDRSALIEQLRDGLAAVVEWSDSGASTRDIGAAVGISHQKVARDIRAGRFLAAHPKSDPVAVKKAYDVLTAGEADKCKSLAELTAARQKKTGEEPSKRGPKKGKKDGGQGDGGKDGGGLTTVKHPTSERFIKYLRTSCPWTAPELRAVEQVAGEMAAAKEKTDASVANVS